MSTWFRKVSRLFYHGHLWCAYASFFLKSRIFLRLCSAKQILQKKFLSVKMVLFSFFSRVAHTKGFNITTWALTVATLRCSWNNQVYTSCRNRKNIKIWNETKFSVAVFSFEEIVLLKKAGIKNTAQKMKFSIKDLLKKSLMENFIFCAVKWGKGQESLWSNLLYAHKDKIHSLFYEK